MTTRRQLLTGSLALVLAHRLPTQAAAASLIRMAYNEKGWPFSEVLRDGSVDGVLVASVELVGHASGLTFQHAGFPWARAQYMVEHGELDGFCTARTEERMVYADFCETAFVTPAYGIFHRADDERPLQIRSLEDMRAFRQGTYRGNGYAKQNLEIDRIQLDFDKLSIFRRIASGNLDIFVEADLTAAILVRRPELAAKIRFTATPFLPSAIYRFGLRRSYPDAAAILARMETAAQAARKSGAFQNILQTYLKKNVAIDDLPDKQ